MQSVVFKPVTSQAIITPRTTRPELFGACQVRPESRGERHATNPQR